MAVPKSAKTPPSRLSAELVPPKMSPRTVVPTVTPVKLEFISTGLTPGWLALIVTDFVVVLMLMTRLVLRPSAVGLIPSTPIVREPVVVVALPRLITPLELVPRERKSVMKVVPLLPVVALASMLESVTAPVSVEATPWMVRVPRPDLVSLWLIPPVPWAAAMLPVRIMSPPLTVAVKVRATVFVASQLSRSPAMVVVPVPSEETKAKLAELPV